MGGFKSQTIILKKTVLPSLAGPLKNGHVGNSTRNPRKVEWCLGEELRGWATKKSQSNHRLSQIIPNLNPKKEIASSNKRKVVFPPLFLFQGLCWTSGVYLILGRTYPSWVRIFSKKTSRNSLKKEWIVVFSLGRFRGGEIFDVTTLSARRKRKPPWWFSESFLWLASNMFIISDTIEWRQVT